MGPGRTGGFIVLQGQPHWHVLSPKGETAGLRPLSAISSPRDQELPGSRTEGAIARVRKDTVM